MGRLLFLLVSSALISACQASEPKAKGPVGAKTSSSNLPSPPENSPMSAPPVAPHQKSVAILAGGCFWGMEDILRKVPGILDTEVGYTGGSLENPTYEDVKHGHTGHAEAVRIEYDPSRISYSEILEKWFFRMHDPTTKNRQGNDVGTQYRSAIFFADEAQERTAREVIERMNQSGFWKRPIVTEVVRASGFTPAEGYHQDYLEKHPGGYTCHFLREEPASI